MLVLKQIFQANHTNQSILCLQQPLQEDNNILHCISTPQNWTQNSDPVFDLKFATLYARQTAQQNV